MRFPSDRLLTRRIASVLEQATISEVAEGMTWYADNHAVIAREVASSAVPMRTACGVAALLSPGTSWDTAIIDAAVFCKTKSWHGISTYKDNVHKAHHVLYGVHPWRVVRGRKVRSFFHNLLYPGSSQLVTIDRHIWRVAASRRLTDNEEKNWAKLVTGYDRLERVYQQMAYARNMLPMQLQAITWLTARRVFARRAA